MNVLVINAGSSSLKYQLLNPETGALLAKGLCERIGIDGKFTYKPQVEGKAKLDAVDVAMPTHSEAIQTVLNALVDPAQRCHRLHEGDRRCGSPRGAWRREVRQAPSSSPTRSWLPSRSATPWLLCTTPPTSSASTPARLYWATRFLMVAVFDTAFHQTMPAKAYTYALPYEYYENDKVRRYGFHGTSHTLCVQARRRDAGQEALRS